jgi:hypothetical protein
MASLALVVLILAPAVSAFYLPGVAPQDYARVRACMLYLPHPPRRTRASVCGPSLASTHPTHNHPHASPGFGVSRGAQRSSPGAYGAWIAPNPTYCARHYIVRGRRRAPADQLGRRR